jgi:hypothetical protein
MKWKFILMLAIFQKAYDILFCISILLLSKFFDTANKISSFISHFSIPYIGDTNLPVLNTIANCC